MDWVKEKMYQARLQRNSLQEKEQIASPDNHVEGDEAIPTMRRSNSLPLHQKLSWLAGGIVLGGVVISMVWRAAPIGTGDEVAGNALEQPRQTVLLPTPSDTTKMKKELASLTEQVQVLNTTVADLQSKLIEIHSVTNSIASAGKGIKQGGPHKQLVKAEDITTQLEELSPPAAGLDDAETSAEKDANTSGDITRGTLTASTHQPAAVDESKPVETTRRRGPWVINLVSLPHKADAERFVEKAESRGVDAELYQVTVKGKTYWRVHVPGFATAAEAKSAVDAIKSKLGLKDVWVAKR